MVCLLVSTASIVSVIVFIPLILSSLWSLALIGLILFLFFLTVGKRATGTVWFAIFIVSATLGRVVLLLRILIWLVVRLHFKN